jgi:hypothetical protein
MSKDRQQCKRGADGVSDAGGDAGGVALSLALAKRGAD